MTAPFEEADSQVPQVGKYHLVDRIAVGGMAEVFLACERGTLALDRLIVIKRILPHLAQDENLLNMFLNEAQIAARIRHPNVVQIYELGESQGLPFIAMEFVPGSTFKELIIAGKERGGLPLGVVLDLLIQACEGAHAAHELTNASGRPYGLVHRDLSPHNLMVTAQGHVKLLDFGIAKPTEATANLTKTGTLKGKVSYMSPEQCRQEPLDRRSDIFALGICAWELLTGTKPFVGRSELATMQKIVRGDLPYIEEHRPDLPRPIAGVIERALETQRERRWKTADAMRRALKQAAAEAGVLLEHDRTVDCVQDLLGTAHDQQKRNVDVALEQTLVTLTAAPLPSPEDLDQSLSRSRTTQTAPTFMRSLGAVGVAGAVLAAALAFTVLLASLTYYWQRQGVSVPPPRPDGPAIVVVLAPTLEPEILVPNFLPIRNYLESELDQRFDFLVANTYEDAAKEVQSGQHPYAILPFGIAQSAIDSGANLQVLATKVIDHSATTDGYLVVHRMGPIQTLADLESHRICFSDKDSQTGWKLPRSTLTAAGINPDADVTWVPSGSHQKAMQDLQDQKCEAAGTYSLNFLGAEDYGINVHRLRVLTITGQTPHDHVVSGPAADPATTQRLTEALLTFDPMASLGVEGVGETERITGFAAGDGMSGP